MSDFRKFLEEQLKDPDFKKAWEEERPNYEAIKKKMEAGSVMPIPPGETIREILAGSGIPIKMFVQKMEFTANEAESLLEGKMDLTPDIAKKLEEVLQVPAEYWSKLEDIYREKLAKSK